VIYLGSCVCLSEMAKVYEQEEEYESGYAAIFPFEHAAESY